MPFLLPAPHLLSICCCRACCRRLGQLPGLHLAHPQQLREGGQELLQLRLEAAAAQLQQRGQLPRGAPPARDDIRLQGQACVRCCVQCCCFIDDAYEDGCGRQSVL